MGDKMGISTIEASGNRETEEIIAIDTMKTSNESVETEANFSIEKMRTATTEVTGKIPLSGSDEKMCYVICYEDDIMLRETIRDFESDGITKRKVWKFLGKNVKRARKRFMLTIGSGKLGMLRNRFARIGIE